MLALLSMRRPQILRYIGCLIVGIVLIGGGLSCGSRMGVRQKTRLPEPMPLPSHPSSVVYLSQPQTLWRELDRWVPGIMSSREFVREAMALQTSREAAQAVALSVDDRKAWSMIRLARGQEVWHFTLTPGGEQQLLSYLAKMPKLGNFGAVRLPRAESFAYAGQNKRSGSQGNPAIKSSENLAWIDRNAHTLTIAPGLRALLSGKEIKKAYGKQPVHIEAEISSVPVFVRKLIPSDFPISRVSAQGRVEAMKVNFQFSESSVDPLANLELDEGALTGLLSDPNTVVAASSRWREHERATNKILREVNREVRKLPFFIKGTAENLAAKLKKLLATWDGKVAVGLGPTGHIRIALGTDQIKRSESTALSLAKSTAEILSTARTFVSGVPKFRLRSNIDKIKGIPVHRFTLYGARSHVPREFSSLLTSDNKLRAAMAWSPRAEALMVVIGPNSTREVKHWLEQHLRAPSAASTKQDLAAVAMSVDPKSAFKMLPNLRVDKIIRMQANSSRRELVLRRLGAHRYGFQYTVMGQSRKSVSSAERRSRSQRADLNPDVSKVRRKASHSEPFLMGRF